MKSTVSCKYNNLNYQITLLSLGSSTVDQSGRRLSQITVTTVQIYQIKMHINREVGRGSFDIGLIVEYILHTCY